MDAELEVPSGDGRCHLQGGWPDVDDLIGIALCLAHSTWRSPAWTDVSVSEFLLATRAAPAELATEIRDCAGLKPEPGLAARALEASYEYYADQLAAIEAAGATGPGR